MIEDESFTVLVGIIWTGCILTCITQILLNSLYLGQSLSICSINIRQCQCFISGELLIYMLPWTVNPYSSFPLPVSETYLLTALNSVSILLILDLTAFSVTPSPPSLLILQIISRIAPDRAICCQSWCVYTLEVTFHFSPWAIQERGSEKHKVWVCILTKFLFD